MDNEPRRNPWEEESLRYDRFHLRIQKCLREVLALEPKSVLELGCGLGILRRELLQRAPQVEYFGCDVSEEAVGRIGDPNVVRVDFQKEALPFSGRKFSCVVGSGIFEYIPDLSEFFREILTRLEPGGGLVASYYNMTHLYRRARKAVGIEVSRHPEWKNNLSPYRFQDELGGAGFRIEKTIPVDMRIGKPKIRDRQPALAAKIDDLAPLKFLLGSQIVFVCRPK